MDIWKLMTRYDKALIIFMLFASIAGMVFISSINKNIGKKDIVVKVGDKIVKTVSVDGQSRDQTYSFQFNGNTGYMEVKDGAVRMLEMPKDICPEKICSDRGWISKKYETIVCLPNKIVISIEEKQDKDQNGVDVIVS